MVGLGKSGVAATRLLRHDGLPVYASDTGTGAAYERWAQALRALGADGAARRPRPGAHRAGGRRGRGPGRAAGRAAARARPAQAGPRDLRRGGRRVPGARRPDALRGHHRHQRQDHDHVAHRPRDGRRPASAPRPRATSAARSATWRSRPDPPDWLALELSSFQLHDAPHLRPAIGVLTNLAPNHLDRYASLEEYYGDKALLFRNAEPGSVWVTNADDAAVQAMVAPVPGTAPPVLDRSGARTAGTTAPAAGSCSGDRVLMPPGRAAAPGRPQRRQRARRGAGGGASRRRSRPRRRRAADLPGHPAPGRAGARGRRRALDQRLEVHQHHLDRGGRGGARPAVRPAAGRPAQGRAVHPARRAAARDAAGPSSRMAKPGRSIVRDLGDRLSGGARRRLRRRARHGARAGARRATRCCCRPPAPATTCSTTTRSAASASGPRWRRCDRASGRSAIRGSCGGRPGSSAW